VYEGYSQVDCSAFYFRRIAMRIFGNVLLACLLLSILTLPCYGVEIRKAVIYNDQAYISLDRTVNGQAVLDAPPEMIVDSLAVVPLKNAVLRSVNIEPSRSESGKVKAIKDELARKKSSLSSARKLQAVWEKEIEIIYDSAGSKGKATAFDKGRVSGALEYIDSKVPGLNNRLVMLAEKQEKLEIEIKDLQDQLNAISRNPGYRITVSADGPVEISYALNSAAWAPLYRVLAQPDKNRLSLELAAQVRQTSGTDWDIKELFISTGRPSYGIQAPDLPPWYLYKERPAPRMATKATADSMIAAAAPEEAAEPEVKATATSWLVGMAGNVHIPGDGTPESIRIKTQNLDAEFIRYAVPKQSPQVYLRAESILKGDLPLVPGTYSAFVDGTFSGRGDMNRTDPGQKLTVDLGIDEGIKMERKEQKVFHEKTLTGKDRTTFAYAVELENTRNLPVAVSLKDQVPVSRDAAITVDLISTNPQVKPDDDGILTWKMDLGPKKKGKAEFSFSVTGTRLMP
jgi:uncharacterized protein (TIGR02231 family)